MTSPPSRETASRPVRLRAADHAGRDPGHSLAGPVDVASSGSRPLAMSSAISAWRRSGASERTEPWALGTGIALTGEPHGGARLSRALTAVCKNLDRRGKVSCLEGIPGGPPSLHTAVGTRSRSRLATYPALSPADRFLCAACRESGPLRQFRVSNPLGPRPPRQPDELARAIMGRTMLPGRLPQVDCQAGRASRQRRPV